MKRMFIVAFLLLGAAAVAGVARPEGSHAAGSSDTPVRTITVTGMGTATSTPIRASLSFGVQTQAPTAKAALAQNAVEMRKVIAALERAGAKDVQTQSVSLSPVFGDNQNLRGYTADNSVSATVTYAAAGSTIDAAVEAGANQVYGPSPLTDDADALYQKALADAVANAREHAEVLAAAAGVKLGSVTAVAEGGASPVPLPYAKTAAADSTPVVPGSQDTTATVVVTFSLS
jgi:uncharacterized protein YggE